MTPKQLCLTAAVVQAIENKVNPGEQDAEKLAKLKETLIKKTREYSESFPKYNKICNHAREYRVDTIEAEDVKFAIFGENENSIKKRILHLEPGTVGFSNFIPAEYLEEMLDRFMNVRTKGGVKEEFKQKRQGVDKNAVEYYNTKLQLYLHVYDEGERNIQEFKKLTLNGLRNIGMLQSCWNVLSKRTDDYIILLQIQWNASIEPS